MNASIGPFIYACLKILILGQQLLRLVIINKQTNPKEFWLCEFNVLISAIESFMGQLQSLVKG